MKDSRGDRTARGGFSFRSHRDIRRPPSRPRGHPILGPGGLPIRGPRGVPILNPAAYSVTRKPDGPGEISFPRSSRHTTPPSSRPRGLTRRGPAASSLTRRGPAAVSRSALCSQGSGRKRRRLSAPALSGLFCRAMPAQADARAEASDAGGFRTAHKKTALQAPQTMLRI